MTQAEATPNPTAPVPATRAPKAHHWLWLLLLGGAFLYGCWGAPFLRIDDRSLVLQNERLTAAHSWLDLLKPDPKHTLYYPLTELTWRLERQLWHSGPDTMAGSRTWATAMRAGNLLCHLGAALFLWAALRRLGLGDRLCAFVTLAFALHPVAAESICWPVERKNVLSGALALLAFFCYVRRSPAGPSLGAAAAFALALLAKISALSLFAMVGVWEFLGQPRGDGPGAATPGGLATRVRHAALRLLPLALLGGGMALVAVWLGSKNLLPPPGGSIGTALLTDLVILQRYLVNLLTGQGLSMYYAVRPVAGLLEPQLWQSGLFLLALVGGTLLAATSGHRRLTLFGWLWFVGALGPNLNLVGYSDLMHDRYIYLSAPGFWLALGLGLEGAAARLPRRFPAAAHHSAVAIVALSLLWSYQSARRSCLFASGSALFLDATTKEPDAAYGHYFVARELLDAALEAEGRGAHQDAAQYWEGLANALARAQASVGADRFYPSHRFTCHIMQGEMACRRGDLPAAAQHARDAEAVLGEHGLNETARAALRHLQFKLHILQGEMACQQGNLQAAREHATAAQALLDANPMSPPARAGLHCLKAQLELLGGDREAAGRHLEAAARLDPANPRYPLLQKRLGLVPVLPTP